MWMMGKRGNISNSLPSSGEPLEQRVPVNTSAPISSSSLRSKTNLESGETQTWTCWGEVPLTNRVDIEKLHRGPQDGFKHAVV